MSQALVCMEEWESMGRLTPESRCAEGMGLALRTPAAPCEQMVLTPLR